MTPEIARESLSVYTMFSDADFFIKILMIGLMLASVWCWAIIFEKIMMFKKMRKQMQTFEDKFWSGGNLDTLYTAYAKSPTDPLSSMFVAAMNELKKTNGKKSALNVTDRIEKMMQAAADKQIEKMENKMVFLASTGSVSPFVGLFGTVWGIMNSFMAIGMTQSANIATVAPGIAEALLATAIGLVAAIPALIAFNKFTTDIDRISGKMEAFSDEFSAILSRQVEG